jgi:hypothetical protein
MATSPHRSRVPSGSIETALARAGMLVAATVAAGALTFAYAAGSAPSPPTTWNGLELTKNEALDAFYKKPDATLSAYRRIMLDPVEVDFRKNWTPDPRSVTSEERERIRRDLAEGAREVFRTELEKKGGYTFVDTPAPDVLRVRAGLTDLYIAAPDTMSAGRSRTYVVSAGQVTLVAELRDSESGELLALAVDRGQARNTGMMQWSTRASNAAEARAVLAVWAGLLRKGLDASKTM